MGYESPLEKEQRLYREAQALKFQAREMRKKRLKEEQATLQEREAEIARKKEAAELERRLKDKEVRIERDARIRTALLKMSDIVKANGLAFEAPAGYKWAFPVETKDVFVLHDKQTGDRVQIRTQHNGFQWD